MKKVLLGMSGGVDSSVSAILLKQEGYEVIGATMKLWEPTNPEDGQSLCCGDDAVYDAKRVCEKLEIPHYTLNFKEEFKKCVIEDFIDCYKNAKTPNPCIECNKHLKFNYFYKKALELGCDYIATGHYARKEYSEEYKRYVLAKSNEEKKDQTYFLYNIPKEVIEHIIFPLQNYTNKEQIRKIAQDNGLLIAKKPDSQEICFIPDNDYANFVIKNMNSKPKKGKIVLKDGKVLGEHNGLIHYTIGQRKGLGISFKEPLYVIGLDTIKNQVIVGNEKDLYSKSLIAEDLNLIAIDQIEDGMKVKAKIRYRAKEADAQILKIENNRIKVEFEEEQRAITSGQSIVLYKDKVVIGGGKIV